MENVSFLSVFSFFVYIIPFYPSCKCIIEEFTEGCSSSSFHHSDSKSKLCEVSVLTEIKHLKTVVTEFCERGRPEPEGIHVFTILFNAASWRIIEILIQIQIYSVS